MWKKSLEKGVSPAGEENWARQWERASSGGRAEQEAPCHCMWQRSGVTTGDRKVRRTGTSQNKTTRCGTVDAGGGNEPDPQETQSGESHAMSRCEQPERGSTHQSTGEAALCVGGTWGDDESDAKHSHRGSS